MLSVLSIDRGKATISTADLYRVVIQPGNEVFDEFVKKDRADMLVREFNACFKRTRRFWAEAEAYPQ